MKEKNILTGNGYVCFSGGECTILKEFDGLLKFFLYDLKTTKIVVNSSGIKFN